MIGQFVPQLIEHSKTGQVNSIPLDEALRQFEILTEHVTRVLILDVDHNIILTLASVEFDMKGQIVSILSIEDLLDTL